MIEPNWIWGLIEVIVLVTLCIVGPHIFAAIGFTAAIFAILYYDDVRSIVLIGNTLWSQHFTYTMSMVPLFILMGAWVESSGLGKDAYDCFMKWLARVKGGLAYVSVLATGVFGAVSGSGIATVAAIGGIGLPEMKRYGYSAPLRTGSIVSGVMIDNLIPPSVTAVLYSLLTDESIGKMFIGGIVPGIVLMFLISVIIYVWVTLRPAAAPRLPSEVRFTLMEKIKGSASTFPIGIIFFFMIGGLYFGWISATEAGAVGAFSVLIIAIVFRRMNRKIFAAGLRGASRTTAMLLIMIGGAFVFAATMMMTRLSDQLGVIIQGIGLDFIPLAYLYMVLIIIVGVPLDTMAILIVFMPIFYPIFKLMPDAPPMAGIWFGIMNVILCSLAALTPPIGTPLYLTQMIDGCATKEVFKGVVPFYVSTVALMALLIHFPFLATWLPSKMIGG
ncbi:MAG: TRAP transporter large permease [Chloroflexota bacterium]